MPRTIGGTLDYSKFNTPAQPAARSAESGSDSGPADRPTPSALDQFQQLDHQGQAAAIRSLAADGFGDHEIAARTGLHVEQIRRLLAVDHAQAAETHARAWSGEQ